jgi:hypothetical protein
MFSTRELVRLAWRIQATIAKRNRYSAGDQQSDWQRLEQLLQEVQFQRRLVETCHARGWRFAGAEKQRDLTQSMLACETAMSRMREHWRDRAVTIPHLSDLLAELRYLQCEFDNVSFDVQEGFIAIQTRSIILDGIDLGPFLVKLCWLRLAERCDIECFEIIALDPRPAENDESVTHPHVRDRRLCGGEATVPVQHALEQGRFVDAFCLVNSVLTNYNASSVYVALADWNGAACWNCGTNEDDRSFCERCEHDFCCDCIVSCKACNRYYCSGCQDRCEVCDEPCCGRCLVTSASGDVSCCADCLTACAGCEESFASSEIEETTGLCLNCREDAEVEPASPEAPLEPMVNA